MNLLPCLCNVQVNSSLSWYVISSHSLSGFIPKPENLPRPFGAIFLDYNVKGEVDMKIRMLLNSPQTLRLFVLLILFVMLHPEEIVKVVLLNNQMCHWLDHCQSVVIPHPRLVVKVDMRRIQMVIHFRIVQIIAQVTYCINVCLELKF